MPKNSAISIKKPEFLREWELPAVTKSAVSASPDHEDIASLEAVEPDYTVAAIERSLQFLETIAQNPDRNLTELAKLMSLSRSVVFRMAFTLEKSGYITKTRDRSGYKLSYRTLYLSACAQDQIPLIQAARPFIGDVARRTGLNVNVDVRAGLRYITILSRHHSDPDNLYVRTGRLGELYAGGAPKVLLAFAPEHVRKQVLAGDLKKFTDATEINPVKIEEKLAEIRRTGINETIRDVYSDGFAFAAPIHGADGSVVAAISIAGILDQLTPKSSTLFRRSVRETAMRISENLGYHRLSHIEAGENL